MAKKKVKYSGIGGQAVLEGIMMKNEERYAVAVRKPDGQISVDVERFAGVMEGSKLKKMPFVRGVFNFVDSLLLGMKSLTHSASFYEEEEEETKFDKALNKLTGGKAEEVLNTLVTVFSVVLAIGIFIVLPYYLSSLMSGFIRNASLMAIIEGVIRIGIFVLYVWLISLMKDIKRLFMYHGAEHKCINCLEHGHALDVRTVMRSSRLHKRCGTSFIFFVLFVSIILFFFIRVSNPFLKVLLRIALMPVVAGISYEIIRMAGRSENPVINVLSAPGMAIQRLTTKEPDESMIEVAIASIEAVFDWKAYLVENFNYDFSETMVYADDEDEVAPAKAEPVAEKVVEPVVETAPVEEASAMQMPAATEEVAEEVTVVEEQAKPKKTTTRKTTAKSTTTKSASAKSTTTKKTTSKKAETAEDAAEEAPVKKTTTKKTTTKKTTTKKATEEKSSEATKKAAKTEADGEKPKTTRKRTTKKAEVVENVSTQVVEQQQETVVVDNNEE